MKQMFVVEGKNDLNKLKSIFKDINVVSVNGSEISKDTLNYLKTISDTHEIILCMDPDQPGKRIRDYLENNLKNVKHIFFDPKYSKSKNNKKIGLEHIDSEILKTKFNEIINFNNKNENNILIEDLINLNLVGNNNSKELRLKLTNYLKIDNCNAKRLLKRLNSLNITKNELNKIMNKLES